MNPHLPENPAQPQCLQAQPETIDAFSDRPLQQQHQSAALSRSLGIAEPQLVAQWLEQARQPKDRQEATQALARQLAQGQREQGHRIGGAAGLVQSLMQQYALSTQEGVALMCLAEALLRIPDTATRDALIREKIGHGHWQRHLGHSPSWLVNSTTWALLITGKLLARHEPEQLGAALGNLVRRGGQVLVRQAVDLAMRLLGEHFITGQDIGQALRNSHLRQSQGFSHSYDMLGEAALTAQAAAQYHAAYAQAIEAIGQAAQKRGPIVGPGISIKLSALHPRYCPSQYRVVMDELYPRLLQLARRARHHDIGLNIDAEETSRLELSLALFERLCLEPELQGYQGLGCVVQAYQKRGPEVIDFLIELAQRSGHRLMVRLVKGAYWDSEIKRAQIEGLSDYPVYTRKAHTDIAYLACARKLLAAPQAVYPQFATHNAHTVTAIYQMADPAQYARGQYEFQCLHGMGEALYGQVVGSQGLDRACRIYAPVGRHDTLLAYLVRRLLENGANTSFVHQAADPHVPIEQLVQDPVAQVERTATREGGLGLPHPAIAAPPALYGAQRQNSVGLDLASCAADLMALGAQLHAHAQRPWQAAAMLAHDGAADVGQLRPMHNPADRRDRVGLVRHASAAEVELALAAAADGAQAWAQTAPEERAKALDRAAQALQEQMSALMSLLMREAGKTAASAMTEVREAIDFLRFYAAQIRQDFNPRSHRPLGPVVCISPWNFPLAIFVGQIAAALAAGNTVLAKPAEQTPLVAAHVTGVLWSAGIPRTALQLLPGAGPTVGASLVADARVQAVLFTGSNEVARLIQQSLARRLSATAEPVALIAETGGQNAMIVDSSALPEQVVSDVLQSAFDSAGQRCSALRVLCLQDEVADTIVTMLRDAMGQLRLGQPCSLSTDVGPVIDAQACAEIKRHIARMRAQGCRVFQPKPGEPDETARGSFVAPTLIELSDLSQLQQEVFGPVLHIVRYARDGLDRLLAQINSTGYALTLGVHSRIDATIEKITSASLAGNQYVNRNMVGAVVGVQPFGGQAMSGTGPKAGGPLYLYRLLASQPADALQRALRFVGASGHQAPSDCIELAGPTGELNLYRLVARKVLHASGPLDASALAQDLDTVVFEGSPENLRLLLQQLAARPGPVVSVFVQGRGHRLTPHATWTERSLSINTAAVGANARLMMLT
jgi:RHH-type proline utilization regulon transcriptional repressor/proline dehydrogenase/delta 1-pyrroline-5-carboxylate dehydrogenase